MRAVNRIWIEILGVLDRDERGANLVEYAILVAFIAVLSIAAITLMGEATSSKFVPVADNL